MTNPNQTDPVAVEQRRVVEAILSAYHTTRLAEADPVAHVLSKSSVQKAFAKFEAEHMRQPAASDDVQPVAWMYKSHLGQSFASMFRRTHYDGFPVTDETPLYAHPPAQSQPSDDVDIQHLTEFADLINDAVGNATADPDFDEDDDVGLKVRVVDAARSANLIHRLTAQAKTQEPRSDDIERVARVLYACEKERSDRCDAIISAAAGKSVRVGMEPWEECWQTFHSDAEAVLAVTQTGGSEERAAIVAWLRDDAGKTRADLSRLHAGKNLTMAQTADWENLISLKTGIADSIERGDHLKGGARHG